MESEFIILPDGLHVWGPEDPGLGAIPDEVVEQHSHGYTLNLLNTPGWRRLDGKNIVVYGDIPDQAMRMVAATGDELIEMLTSEFGGPLQNSPYIVRIFDKREDFCRYARRCGAGNALSLYDPRTMEIGLHFGDQADREDFESTYAHEFVHAFMDRIYGVTEPLWFAEGMAEYFSRLEWTNRGYRPTGKNWRAMMVMGEELMPLRDILSATRETMYGVNFPLYYGQSWGLVRFLLKRHPELVDVLLHKNKLDLNYLSRDYMAYLKRLRRG